MRNIAVGVFRAVLKPSRRHSCRWVAGSRHAINRRSFHRSTVTCQTPNQLPTSDENSIAARSIPRHVSPAPTEAGTKVSNTDNVQEGHGEEDGHIAHATAVETDHLLKEDADTLEDGDTARTGTRSKRQWSRKRPPPQGLPPVSLPPWFIENNIIRFDATTTHRTDLAVANSISSEPQDTEAGDALEQASDSKRFSRAADRVSECQLAPVEEAKYAINVDVYLEVAAAIRSALSMRPDTGFADKKLLPRPVTMLHCPKDGGTMFLDSVVQTISSKLEADLLVVDAQDIAQIVGPYLDENQAWLPSSTALLGYTTQKFAGKLEELEEEVDDSEDADETQGSEGLDITRHSAPSEARHPLSNSIFKVITSSLDNLPQFMSTSVPGTGRSPSDRLGSQLKLFVPDSIGSFPKPGSTQWLDLKANNVLEAIVDSIYAKAQSAESAPSRKVIVQIKDFKEIISSPNGFELMNKLRNIIDRRWSEGKDIIMLGTTSTEADGSAITKVEIQHAQIDTVNGERRTIIVPPHHSNSFESDERARIRQINVRHIEDMIRQLAQGSSLTPPAVDIEEDLSTDEAYLGGLEDAVWMHSSVQRIASTILGLETPQGVINGPIFAKAVDLLASSDEAKFEWSLKELQQEDLDVEELEARENEAAAATLRGNKMNQAKLKKIKKDATTHEAKFLGGVIMPADIKTTFSSVHAPKETIDALKTLTSLSLIRPEAFAYGVLATDKIPGLLLYGPPGYVIYLPQAIDFVMAVSKFLHSLTHSGLARHYLQKLWREKVERQFSRLVALT